MGRRRRDCYSRRWSEEGGGQVHRVSREIRVAEEQSGDVLPSLKPDLSYVDKWSSFLARDEQLP